jgi:hypothetical protein
MTFQGIRRLDHRRPLKLVSEALAAYRDREKKKPR